MGHSLELGSWCLELRLAPGHPADHLRTGQDVALRREVGATHVAGPLARLGARVHGVTAASGTDLEKWISVLVTWTDRTGEQQPGKVKVAVKAAAAATAAAITAPIAAFLALLLVSVVFGLAAQWPKFEPARVLDAMQKGMGGTLGFVAIVVGVDVVHTGGDVPTIVEFLCGCDLRDGHARKQGGAQQADFHLEDSLRCPEDETHDWGRKTESCLRPGL